MKKLDGKNGWLVLSALLALASGCGRGRDSGTVTTQGGGTVHQFAQVIDSDPNGTCAKPRSKQVQSISIDETGSRVRLAIEAGGSAPTVVPTGLTYARYTFGPGQANDVPVTGTVDAS